MRALTDPRCMCLAGAAALLVVAAPLAAQTARGQIGGVVVEAGSGAPVGGADVWVSAPTLRRTVTDPEGRWGLDPGGSGPWLVQVRMLGFASWEDTVETAAGRELRVVLTPRPVALDAIVVTAARRIQTLGEAPVATELVSRREIRETGASDLTSVLTERTGVELQGGHPAGAGLMIQGMGSERVLILVDGQPYIGRIAGMIDASRIPTSMIERIEVVKGPQSTLYGSEAMGGVVNVVTRAPAEQEWSLDAAVTGGDQGRREARAGISGGGGRLSVLADAGRRVAELVPGRPDEAGASTARWDGLLRLGWKAADSLAVDASALVLDERQSYRTGQLNSFADNLQWSGRMRAVWERGRQTLTPAVYATAFEHSTISSTSTTRPESGGERETQRLMEGEVLYSLRLDALTVDAGVEGHRESIRSDRVRGYRRDINTLESFVQGTIVAGPVYVVPGVRASFSDPWGSHWTPRVALMMRPAANVALRASLGEGFRAPDFKELHMKFLNIGPGFAYTVRGNPDLLPESSRNVTAGAEWTGQRTYLRVEAYHNRFDRFIETQAVGDSSGVTVYTYGNIDDGFTRGVEVEAGLTWAAWRAEGSYGALRAEHGLSEPLLGRPEASARGSVGWAHPSGLRASVTGVYTGTTPMQRTEDGSILNRDPYLRFDARVARALPLGMELVMGAENVFDAASPEWPGFTGRQLYVAMSWGQRGMR